MPYIFDRHNSTKNYAVKTSYLMTLNFLILEIYCMTTKLLTLAANQNHLDREMKFTASIRLNIVNIYAIKTTDYCFQFHSLKDEFTVTESSTK